MSSIVQICNLALTKLGAARITSLTDDTKQARALNAIYEATRDAELSACPWSFATKRAAIPASATVTKVARPDGLPGYVQRLTCTNPGAAGSITFETTAAVTASAGQVWRLRGSWQASSLSLCEGVEVAVMPQGVGSTSYWLEWGGVRVSGDYLPTGSISRQCAETPMTALPTGTTGVKARVRVRLDAGGTATVDLYPGEWELVQIS